MEKKSQRHQISNTFYPSYGFRELHRSKWLAFWDSVGSTLSGCQTFALEAGYEDPKQFAASLYKFLFRAWPGDDEFQRLPHKVQDTPTEFREFLHGIATQHLEHPQDKAFYISRGLTIQSFLEALQRAQTAPTNKVVLLLNSITPNLGDELFEEFVLVSKGLLKAANELEDLSRELERRVLSEDTRLERSSVS